MPMRPRSGRLFEVRQRKSWSSSSLEGDLKEKTWHPLRVDPRHDVLDGAVLARRVHGLKDQEHAPLVLRVELLLQLSQDADPFLEPLLGFFLVLEPARFAWVDVLQPEPLAVRDPVGPREIACPAHGSSSWFRIEALATRVPRVSTFRTRSHP